MDGALHFSEKEDLLKFISENNIRILNLCHIPEDGRLKTLSFSASDRERIKEILDFGARVDGSNLFSTIKPQKSDIFIMPDVNRAFVDPFPALPTLTVLCDYKNQNGKPLETAPKTVLARAEKHLSSSANITLKALAELEFYIVAEKQTNPTFLAASDKNYHESAPFAKFQDIRNEVLATLEAVGIHTKYGHGEVGLVNNRNNVFMEQHEIEFRPDNLTKMAETIAVAKWVIRNVCARHGVSASFIPKIDLNHAGTGMHVHTCAIRNGNNIIPSADGTLSGEAMKIIGAILKFAPSLAAFGNPTPASYLRLIAHKESPMHICWGAHNRLALIRLPLWWGFNRTRKKGESCVETFEYRAPDAFADAYLLFAGLAVATDYGLKNSKECTSIAENLHVETSENKNKNLKALPRSCNEAAANLEADRHYYEAHEIFPPSLIDETLRRLRAFNDRNLWKDLASNPDKLEKTITEYIDYG